MKANLMTSRDLSDIRYNIGTVSLIMKEYAMLTTEMKRQAFLKLRTENYRASLRLEGLEPRTASTTKSTTKPVVLKSRHVR